MEIGARVAEARSECGVTQAQLAASIAMDRTALAKVESGTRRVAAVELVAIARELGRRVEWFVDEAPPALVSYRGAHPGVAVQAIDTNLDSLVRDAEFVTSRCPGLVAGQPEPLPYPATAEEAEKLAVSARRLLGLEPGQPAHDLSGLLAGIGLLVFAMDLDEGADAGTVLLRRGGVCLINGHWRVGRRRLAAAHELGHYLVADEFSLDWRVAAAEATGIESRLDRFARALLLPAEDLRERWTEWLAITDETWRDAAVRAASHYGADMATLARRLSEVGAVDRRRADDIRRVQTKQADIVEKNLVVRDELAPVALPRPYEQAVLKLYRGEVITADRALGLLRGSFDEDELPSLPPAPETEIWEVTS
ncbi:Helix-turn-helix domain-containing protein [Streptomyces sp. WMMB 714]|uniref:helix-turn-helix domain-containing protein n=1 Tax=Streptomyces sp. WMMB 714 TaxID=1286822 RepID=UPI0005F77A0B|nr:XRE family transcriptional regulator [Streptomyces sp. WMMB 714]SCK23666.1 Helix-turn-helix domain-containing protein [Streptomyces sp. WMMB 714]